MDKNEIKESRNEVSRIVKKPVENIYGMASLVRVFFARAIDLLIVAIPAIILNWTYKAPDLGPLPNDPSQLNWQPLAVHEIVPYAVALGSILVFLVIIPSFFNGTTIGKAICGIRLKRSKGDKKVKWYMLLAREVFFLGIPWAVATIVMIIGLAIGLHSWSTGSRASTAAQVIFQVAYILYFFWFIFLLITIKAQDEHQSGIDMHFGLYVVYKEPIKQITKEVVVKERSVILTDEPGNLSKDNLDELRNDEERKFDKSISLEDLDLEIDKDTLKKNKKDSETKKIEGKANKKNKGKGEKK